MSLCTSTGVFIHDMQLDKAAATALALPAVMASYQSVGSTYAGVEHTHVERGSLAQAVHDLRSNTTPRMLPRDDNRKYVLSKKVVKGIHAFDGYYMPLSF
jgi:hypothetical protein